MKATTSKDGGTARVTLRIEHRLGLVELAGALAAWVIRNGEFDRKLNRREAIEAVRERISERGIDVTWTWADDEPDADGEVEEARDWGEATAERCFGPLFPRGQQVID